MAKESNKGNGAGLELNIPPSYYLTKDAWMRWIAQTFPEFKGHLEGAAILMGAFIEGKMFVQNEFQKEGRDFNSPDLAISRQVSGMAPVVGKIGNSNQMYVDISYLEMCSKYDPETSGSSTGYEDNIVLHKGTIVDFFRLAGVEETHHAIREQIKGEPINLIDNRDSIAYQAQDHEYEALEMKVKFAKKKNMRKETIEVLEDLLKETIKYRNKKK